MDTVAPPVVASRRRPYVTCLFLALGGLYFAAGGAWLVGLSGSWYYVITGLVLLGVAALAWRRSPMAMVLYAVLLLATLAWSISEVSLDVWQLEPRLVVPVLFGSWLLLPPVRRAFMPGRAPAATLGIAVLLVVAMLGFAATEPRGIEGQAKLAAAADAASSPAVDGSVPPGDWWYYGRTTKGDRYSPLGQINAGNVRDLKVAWTARTGDLMRAGEDRGGTDAGHEFNFEDTPIKVGDTLYVCTGHSWVVALDARTGARRWSYDPKADTSADVYLACRGVAYWRDPNGGSGACAERIIAPVLDARLLALDARTGKPCEDFGEHGFISLRQYLGHVAAGFHFVTSPPLVVNDRVILGGWIYDNQATFEPSGAVRAFDPKSGALVWAWDVGHDPQNWKPGPNDELTRGTPNAWGIYTADLQRGLVFLPTGNATPDYYGGQRRAFDDRYSSSTVALDIETGAPRWTFQNVHHDLWDFDVPTGPSLVDLPGPNGTTVPALVQTTKRGELFMLNRETGQPISAVQEIAVPQGAVNGDRTSPTQPFSVGMPSLAPVNLTEAAMWGATPFDQLACRITFRRSIYQGQFTPPQLQQTIVYPAFDGVIDWQGASIDPQNKLLIANANYIPFLISLAPRGPAEAKGLVPPWNGNGNEPKIGGGLAPQYGTPYVGSVHPWLNPIGVPCNPPPWGTLTAIDLVSKRIVWQHPIGTTRDTGPFGTHANLPLPTGIFNIGGNMVTAGGLVFIGATADDYLRAIDERTGKVVWRARLPAGGQANPMSYEVDGRQYVVIAAGGHAGLGTRSGDYVIAYALPSGGP
ncbi:MAG: membrane-bound PQQ-dependent dehydrogenase, glucose/quinate/shikimate family [Proteobacteria bacterium]|nr:membrane-bound PQQ-dependent dehydrogenase, glucose/quinate/shikimate family [Pseudomonadota bacterium]